MKKTGAYLLVYALEQLGIKHTFGIPGVHNTEIYDAIWKRLRARRTCWPRPGTRAFMLVGAG